MLEANISYMDHGIELEGFVAYPSHQKHPLVILCHAWKGRDDFICEKAKRIASWGYVGFALDMYGKGIIGKTKEENARLKKPFLDDRKLLQTRVLKAYETAISLSYVHANQVVVLGFGFGGLCALDLARAGVPLQGAISVYGHFASSPLLENKPIQAKILILHGYDDPITPQSELLTFEEELTRQKVDWQAHLYGDTMHAFATPGSNDPSNGILYNPQSEQRAWSTIYNFLNEII